MASSVRCLQVSLHSATSPILDNLLTLFNSTIFRKNYVFLSVVFVSAFGLEMYARFPIDSSLYRTCAFDNASNSVWNSVNKGRQWKDLKQKYMENDDE
ncbi:hypothetical protein E4T39_00466 [Aureobasidium subglaciale]|nr:hypothetical protein E4T39_00466 [Aureobasidium subglaciale]